jgi:hypothetical protein
MLFDLLFRVQLPNNKFILCDGHEDVKGHFCAGKYPARQKPFGNNTPKKQASTKHESRHPGEHWMPDQAERAGINPSPTLKKTDTRGK